MKQAFSTFKPSSPRGRLLRSMITAAVAVGAILASAGSAAAADSGVFTGHETAPNSVLVTPPIPSLCAKFTPTSTAPLKVELQMTGTLSYGGSSNGTATTRWTATFVNSGTDYWASPRGTFTSEAACKAPLATGGGHVVSDAETVPGIVIKDSNNTVRCSGAGYFERHDSSLITLVLEQRTGTAENCPTGTDKVVTFTGVEEPCPNPDPTGMLPDLGCPDPFDTGNLTLYNALLQGTYSQ